MGQIERKQNHSKFGRRDFVIPLLPSLMDLLAVVKASLKSIWKSAVRDSMMDESARNRISQTNGVKCSRGQILFSRWENLCFP